MKPRLAIDDNATLETIYFLSKRALAAIVAFQRGELPRLRLDEILMEEEPRCAILTNVAVS
jgi:hypothetical protein